MSKQLQTTEEAIATVQENNQEYYDLAIEYAEKWIETRFKPFTSEDLSADMYLVLGVPKELRVLGAVINNLKNRKLIKHNGYAKYRAKQGHSRPSSVWISLKYSQIQSQNRKAKMPELKINDQSPHCSKHVLPAVHLFPYRWTLKDAVFTKDKGKVFSCFACGGGSTMGYKLSGFDVIGHNDIDKKMIEVYKLNHNPKYSFLESITTFSKRKDLPKELYELDILDGSPPCSSFSMAGNREKDWGKEKVFREGQELQVLDTLFFDFIDLAKELQPKVVVAENVKGLLIGEAKQYVIQIYREFAKAGYNVQHWLVDASDVGVPQRRERVFFIALRNDLCDKFMHQKDLFTQAPELNLDFKEPKITFGEFYQKAVDDRPASKGKMFEYWNNRKQGDESFCDTIKRTEGVERCFTNKYLYQDIVPMTYTSNSDVMYLFDEYRKPNKFESCCIGSYPLDYNFYKVQYNYLIGMSVPPVMTAQIANQIYKQWLSVM